MWSYNFPTRINCISSDDHYIAFGCENGWIYLFNRNGLKWSKKIVGTYYRGPFTDVNVTSIDVYNGYVAVGTDFVDGKLYLFDLNGREIWKRQMLSVLSCWERPDDVKFVRISDDSLAVVSGFINDKILILDFGGDELYRSEVNDFIKCMDYESILALCISGRSVILYPFVRKYEFVSDGVLVVEDWAIFYNKNGAFCTRGWKIKASNPVISANSNFVVVSSLNYVHLYDIDGNLIESYRLDENVRSVLLTDDSLAYATDNAVYLNGERIYEGRVFKLCDRGVLVKSDGSLSYVELW